MTTMQLNGKAKNSIPRHAKNPLTDLSKFGMHVSTQTPPDMHVRSVNVCNTAGRYVDVCGPGKGQFEKRMFLSIYWPFATAKDRICGRSPAHTVRHYKSFRQTVVPFGG